MAFSIAYSVKIGCSRQVKFIFNTPKYGNFVTFDVVSRIQGKVTTIHPDLSMQISVAMETPLFIG